VTKIDFSVFDHIEYLPGAPLDKLYGDRLRQIEHLDAAGFYGNHLAEHHTPATHAMAPSQNVFLTAASQRTERLRLIPTVYVLPLYHPLRLIEEICMLDALSDGRLEIAVGAGGVLEAYFWGHEGDPETNRARFEETLAIVRQGLTHDELNYQGRFHSFDRVPMRLRPKQQPCPPFWYMRNTVTAAKRGFNVVIEGSLDHVQANVGRYRRLWAEAFGQGAPTEQGREPKVGANFFTVVADTDAEAVALASKAWDAFRENLLGPRRREAERRGLAQFLTAGSAYASGAFGADEPPAAAIPTQHRYLAHEEMREIEASISHLSAEERAERERRRLPGGLGKGILAGPNVIAGSPDSIRAFMDEYVTTGANYLSCAFQFGCLTHDQAMRSVELFSTEVIPRYRQAAVLA
jgi:alkanesulfonate monooxygenase SsuD/methylene tetrahydromethanopterin reductase-like flavin-dependent oxidoreductase (luciferase family)